MSCEDNPNDIGLEFILSDTLFVKVLDSYSDSLSITNNNYRNYINNYISPNILIGKYQGYESKGLLRFIISTGDYDSASVLSATLKLTYSKYAFQDSLAALSFNIYNINKYYNFQTITADSFSMSDVGNTVLGSYSGSPIDTVRINIPFSTQKAKDWLEYAADTNYSVKNYGIIMIPNSSSGAIKGFYSMTSGYPDLSPELVVVVSKNSDIDTLSFRSESMSLNTNSSSFYLPDRFILQNGIGYFNIMNFDISKLPGKVIINEAYLKLTLDNSSSFISSSSDKRLQMSMVLDSSLKTTETNYKVTEIVDSVTYTIRLNSMFQKWNLGTAPNYGVLMSNLMVPVNLDKYVFYSSSFADSTKRPRLIIRYTPRG